MTIQERVSTSVVLNLSFSGNTFDYMKNLWNTKINDLKKQTKAFLSRVEINILLNVFKFYILKCIIKFCQSHYNNKKKEFGFYNFAEHLQKARLESLG